VTDPLPPLETVGVLPPHTPPLPLAGDDWTPTLAPADGTAYDPDRLERDLYLLATRYPDVRVTRIGTSRDQRPLLAACIGQGPATVQINAAHHAREHMTINLAMAWLEFYAQALHERRPVAGEQAGALLARQQLCVLPAVNPDGVALVQRGAEALRDAQLRAVARAANGYSADFGAWKANGAGVDLNSNYPWRWAEKPSPGGPAPAQYKGPQPFSEPETRAVRDFTLAHDTRLVISLHAAGDVLFWYVNQQGTQYDEHLAITAAIAAVNGYRPEPPAESSALGGMKDWFVGITGRYGVTVEIGGPATARPVAPDRWAEVWRRNWQVPLTVLRLTAALPDPAATTTGAAPPGPAPSAVQPGTGGTAPAAAAPGTGGTAPAAHGVKPHARAEE
jgi:hypothetical protein